MTPRPAFRLPLLLLLACLGAALSGGPLRADGGGGSDDDDRSQAAPDCPAGQVRDRTEERCVEQTSARLGDADRTAYAYRLAKAGRYQEALALLDTLRRPDTAEALNYRGYATRKLGRVDEGIGYYLQSVRLDPKYAKVREYLGEAYVTQGRLDLAREQLRNIQGLCGTGCEEYRDLARAIAGSASL
ncbi:Tetratricopeptide repeat-containing protein [Pseudomonas delhiensis]|uniref:Tetratricopeptide repeat-containing protein n=1 Tax=Pseudomonas delhiensis TaxID=366289 RepID=A0A239NIH5_9PSED|nr:tetratricopeptide repeat protein [Pseudomonas delhiensis]SDK97295.1 Tetratricopeptide repeat-containing protein [Pseudomonas delhiensis]SNT54701.1 Tetratricopeptide repeat-containing protein [Pseudomonas delhiensis]